MDTQKIQREILISRLEKAVHDGDTETAEMLVDALYPKDAPKDIAMPADFPFRVAAAAEKGRATMKKTSVVRKVAASAAAVALVFSLGITAYAQGWFVNPVSVMESENLVVTGEDVSSEQAKSLLAENDAKTEIYKKTEEVPYADFQSACEVLGLPYVYPGYLEEHPEFVSEHGAVAVTNPELPDKQVFDDYFDGSGKGISLSISYQEDAEKLIAAYSNRLQVENTRAFTTDAGDVYTLYDIRYTDSDDDKLVEAVIGINNYLFNIMFCDIAPEDMAAALNSIDLTPLK